MASQAEDATSPIAQKIPKVGASSSEDKITYAVPFSVVPPIDAIVDKPSAEPNPLVVSQTSQIGESSAPSQVDPSKTKRKGKPKNVIVALFDSEHSSKPSPSSKTKKTTPKRRKVARKQSSTQSPAQAPQTVENPQVGESNPHKEAPKSKRGRASVKKVAPSTTTSSRQALEIEKIAPAIDNPSHTQ